MPEIKGKALMDGVKIASFCLMGAGPLIFKYFGQFGATVVKVESHSRIDPMRMANLFQNARLCDVAYVGTSGIQRTDEPAFEFRFGLRTGGKEHNGEGEKA